MFAPGPLPEPSLTSFSEITLGGGTRLLLDYEALARQLLDVCIGVKQGNRVSLLNIEKPARIILEGSNLHLSLP